MNDQTCRSLEFDNLPLVEVATRLTLAKPQPMKLATVDKYREALRGFFDTIDDTQRFEVPPGYNGNLQVEPGKISAVVLTSKQSPVVLYVQADLLAIRWEAGTVGEDYPRYEKMRKIAETAWRTAREILPEARVRVANMSYSNLMRMDTGDLRAFFSSAVQIPSSADALHSTEVSWRLDDNVDLRFKLEKGRLEALDQKEPEEAYRFTTAAGKILSEGEDPMEVLDSVHDALIRVFPSLISTHAKKQWKMKGHNR